MNGGWHFVFPNGGPRIDADTEDDLRKKVVLYAVQQKIALDDIQNKISDYICNGPSGANLCQQIATVNIQGVPHHQIFTDNFAEAVVKNANKLAEKGTVPLVDQAEAHRRAEICANCPQNASKSLCPNCMQHSRQVFTVIRKGAGTPVDDRLQFCNVFKMCTKTFPWLANPKEINPTEAVPGNCWNK
jgi:hypothetical protein